MPTFDVTFTCGSVVVKMYIFILYELCFVVEITINSVTWSIKFG